MQLTKRQALFLIIICLLASKVQRLPSLVCSSVGRHGYLVFLLNGLIDCIMVLACLFFNKQCGKSTAYQTISTAGGGWLAKVIFVLLAGFFFFNAILPYEAVHDLFANILFDHLSWGLYSLILVGSVLFIASRGLKNLGRLCEVFFYLIIICFGLLLIMGLCTTDLFRIMPLADIQWQQLFHTSFEYNIWFGDFLIIYIFIGKTKQDDGRLGWPIVVAIAACTIVLTLTYMVFYGLYENLASDQNSLISSISQFALLGLDIGRVDWFLVLFFQISTIISASTYLFASAYCLLKVFSCHKAARLKNIVKEQKEASKLSLILLGLVVMLYILDVFIFKSNHEGVAIMATITKYFGAFMILVLPLILLIIGAVAAKKRKNQENTIKNGFKTLIYGRKLKKVKSAALAKRGER